MTTRILVTMMLAVIALTGCASVREQGRSDAEGRASLCRVMIASGQIAGNAADCESKNRDDRSPGGYSLPPAK